MDRLFGNNNRRKRTASTILAQAALDVISASFDQRADKKNLYLNEYKTAYEVFYGPVTVVEAEILPAVAHFALEAFIPVTLSDGSLQAASLFFYQHLINQRRAPESSSDLDDSTPPVTP